jgi:hypothetical protein
VFVVGWSQTLSAKLFLSVMVFAPILRLLLPLYTHGGYIVASIKRLRSVAGA